MWLGERESDPEIDISSIISNQVQIVAIDAKCHSQDDQPDVA